MFFFWKVVLARPIESQIMCKKMSRKYAYIWYIKRHRFVQTSTPSRFACSFLQRDLYLFAKVSIRCNDKHLALVKGVETRACPLLDITVQHAVALLTFQLMRHLCHMSVKPGNLMPCEWGYHRLLLLKFITNYNFAYSLWASLHEDQQHPRMICSGVQLNLLFDSLSILKLRAHRLIDRALATRLWSRVNGTVKIIISIS